MSGRKILPLVLLVLLVSALMTYQARGGALPNPLYPINEGFYTFSNVLGGFTSNVRNTFSSIFNREQVQGLEKETATLRKQLDSTQEIWRENARLKALLALKESTPQFVTAANVVARGSKRWANTFTLDAGADRGVEKDMVVVVPQGLVGKIIQAERSFSKVQLINDVRFSLAVRVQETRKEAILSGTGTWACRLKYFPHEEKIEKNYTLISSGLDGIYPEGLRVGFVSRVSKEAPMFQEVEVVPFVDTERVEEVAIIRR
jgi:rod shape-determining protein MreC